jgi:hypothetical protein
MITHRALTDRPHHADLVARRPRTSAGRLLGAAALVAIAVASPARAHAQQPLDSVHVRRSAAAATARADALDARAAALERSFRDPRQLRRSAELRERAAGLRAEGDSLATASLQWAAAGRYYSGERDAAGQLMEAAAARATAMGDVVRAVNALMDAAAISAELGRARHAASLVEQATVLSASPLLNVEQRRAMLRRIAPASPPAAATADVARR